VPVVDDQLGLLIPRDVAASVDCLSLGVVDGGNPSVTFATHGPIFTMSNYMLVLSHRENLLISMIDEVA
jgi:hypothetical protein